MSTDNPNPAPEQAKPSTPADTSASLVAGAAAEIEKVLGGDSPPAPEPAPVEPAAEAAAPAAPTAEPAPTEPAAPAPASEPPAAKQPEEEIAELGIKSEKAKERFKELSTYKSAVHQAGIEKLEDLPNIVERAKFADELESAIVSTGASPEQYANAIQYLALVNSGKPDSLAKAYDVMQGELAALAKVLGKEAPGIHDPLKEHPDLAQEYEKGEISKERALEIVSQRAVVQMTSQQAQQAEQQRAQQAEQQRVINELNVLGAKLQASDPLYQEKIAALTPTIALIRERCPPAEWPERVAAAYRQVVLPAVARQPAPAPLPPPGPVRGVVPAGVSMTSQAKSAEEAIAIALASMNGVR